MKILIGTLACGLLCAGLIGCQQQGPQGDEYGVESGADRLDPPAEENTLRDNIPAGEVAGRDADTTTVNPEVTPGALPPTDSSTDPGQPGTPGAPPSGANGPVPEGQLPPNQRLPGQAGQVASPNEDTSAGVPPAAGVQDTQPEGGESGALPPPETNPMPAAPGDENAQ